jgi:two-component system sensor histidine kinase MprB
MNLPIRARLTLWYVAILALTLLLFAAGVMAFVRREQRVAVDRALRERTAEFATVFAAEWAEEPGDKAVQEAVATLARSDGALFVYARPKRLIARAPRGAVEIPIGALPPEVTLFTAAGFRCIVAPLDAAHVLVATQNLAPQRAAFAELRRALLVFVPAALLLAALGGSLLARRSLAPVTRMTDDASRIEALRLYAMRPEHQWLFGVEQRTTQTGAQLRRGGRVWLY